METPLSCASWRMVTRSSLILCFPKTVLEPFRGIYSHVPPVCQVRARTCSCAGARTGVCTADGEPCRRAPARAPTPHALPHRPHAAACDRRDLGARVLFHADRGRADAARRAEHVQELRGGVLVGRA